MPTSLRTFLLALDVFCCSWLLHKLTVSFCYFLSPFLVDMFHGYASFTVCGVWQLYFIQPKSAPVIGGWMQSTELFLVWLSLLLAVMLWKPKVCESSLSVLCIIDSFLCRIVDDIELYEDQRPFSLAELVALSSFLNVLCFNLIWHAGNAAKGVTASGKFVCDVHCHGFSGKRL